MIYDTKNNSLWNSDKDNLKIKTFDRYFLCPCGYLQTLRLENESDGSIVLFFNKYSEVFPCLTLVFQLNALS